jgi:hypothetical protein
MALGQAAGTAAAICSRENLPVAEINCAELRVALESQGAII